MRKLLIKWAQTLIIALLISLAIVLVANAASGGIDATQKWAWGTNIGWVNFDPSHGDVTVYDDHLEGYAWSESIGWIRLGSYEGGGVHTYANDAVNTYGVNHDGAGNLSGYAWGTNIGWINFNPTHGGVTINLNTGSFDGYAWSENIGWIHFKNSTGITYNVVTSYRPDEIIGGSNKGIFIVGSSGGSFKFGLVKVFIPQGTVDMDCYLLIEESASGKFTLGDQVYDIRINCDGQNLTQLNKLIQVCVRPTDGITNGKQLFHMHSGAKQFTPLFVSDGPAVYVCGDTDKLSLFALGTLQLPATGFARGVEKKLPNQTSEKGYVNYENLWLEVPSLGVELPIVGVPLTGEGWDVTWLGNSAGYLEGTAYPTWAGNTAITAHVWDSDNNPGPFVNLHSLKHGDQIIIHAWGLKHIYEVRNVMQVKPDKLNVLPHSDYDMLTLITCKEFNESSGEYDWRLAVQAVLMSVEAE